MVLERMPMRLTSPTICPDLDDVAELHRTLESEDQPGHEIVDDVLQAEADADAERAGNDRQPGEIEARGGDGQQEAEAEHGVVDEQRDRIGQAAGQRQPRKHVLPNTKRMKRDTRTAA